MGVRFTFRLLLMTIYSVPTAICCILDMDIVPRGWSQHTLYPSTDSNCPILQDIGLELQVWRMSPDLSNILTATDTIRTYYLSSPWIVMLWVPLHCWGQGTGEGLEQQLSWACTKGRGSYSRGIVPTVALYLGCCSHTDTPTQTHPHKQLEHALGRTPIPLTYPHRHTHKDTPTQATRACTGQNTNTRRHIQLVA